MSTAIRPTHTSTTPYGNLIAQATLPAGASPTPKVYLYRGERYDADLAGLY